MTQQVVTRLVPNRWGITIFTNIEGTFRGVPRSFDIKLGDTIEVDCTEDGKTSIKNLRTNNTVTFS